MNITLINYADEKYRKTQELCSRTGRLFGGVKNVISYSPENIDQKFYEKNKQILETKRGAGLWLWKPYIIDKTLEQVHNGDYVFYCDSGAYFTRSIKGIIDSMKQDIWVSDIPLIEKQWTKPKCFKLLDLDVEEYKDSNQIQASFLCIKKSEFSVAFVREWLCLCCEYELISPEEADKTNLEQPEFIAHREDQSILSLLCKKNGIKPHKDPSQFGRYPEGYKQPGYMFRISEHPDDKYKTVIVHHRLRNVGKKALLKSYLIACGSRGISDYLFWRHRK